MPNLYTRLHRVLPLVTLVAASMLATGVAIAQPTAAPTSSSSSFAVYVAGEAVRPMGPTPFIERWQAAWGGAAGVGLRIPFRRELELMLWAARSGHKLEDANLLGELGFDPQRASIDGGTIVVQTVNLRARYIFEEGARWYPYVFVQGGAHRSHFEDVTIRQDGASFTDEGVEETVLGVGFGGGLQVPIITRWSAFFEGGYTVTFSENLFHNRNGDSDLVYRLPIRLGLAISL